MEDFLDFFVRVTRIGAMFGVNRVEEAYLIISGYVLAKEKEAELIDEFMRGYRTHVNDFFDAKDQDWFKLIRFYSGSDRHSIELMNETVDSYIQHQRIDPSEAWPTFKK
jgi:hypothetical protein